MLPFDEMPRIEGEHIILREMVEGDAPALEELSHSAAVYRYLPTFLYEQSRDDVAYVIRHLREDCFDTKESIILAICACGEPD